LFPSL